MESAVARLYDTFPFPPDPVLEEAPPGYNWRWCWQSAHGFCTGGLASHKLQPRILDAGCGSGVSTEYLAHLNPTAEIVAIDISAGTLKVAQERIHKTVPVDRQITFQQLSLFDLEQIPGEFDLINSVGVLHHTPDPVKALQCLANKLAPGGLLHIFVYAEIGRWEIRLMQEAIELLRLGAGMTGMTGDDFRQGVALGRQLFASLPPDNRLVQREKSRWALENQRDECFADMYLHPLEKNFNVESLFQMIDKSGLEFVGFSNPQVWELEKLLGSSPELLGYAQNLSPRHRLRLLELLDTDIAHYEFFLYRPPLPQMNFDQALAYVPQLQPCIQGWPSPVLFDPDYQVVHLSNVEYEFMGQCDGSRSIGAILATNRDFDLSIVRGLLAKRLILLGG